MTYSEISKFLRTQGIFENTNLDFDAVLEPKLNSPFLKVWSNSTQKLPLVLCGPMVRRVEPDSVTVWVALKEKRTVTLSVHPNIGGTPGPVEFEGAEETLAFGKFLHIVAVTVKAPAGKRLAYGSSYFYNLHFGSSQDLKETDPLGPVLGGAKLTYNNEVLPSFVLPPEDNVNKIHFVHGSCRGIDCPGKDALVGLDTLLAESWNGRRPQQLFLSGDQIYADEGNEILENMTIDVGNYLMGDSNLESGPAIPAAFTYLSTEKVQDQTHKTHNPATIVAGERGGDNAEEIDYIHNLCGFTPTSRFHLFSLAEFFACYLLTWSDALWPRFFTDPNAVSWAFAVSHTDSAAAKAHEKIVHDLTKEEQRLAAKLKEAKNDPDRATAQADLKRIRSGRSNAHALPEMVLFAQGLSKVRRALANIATYTMFDDHEVTDDWHMSREWVHRAYGLPLGRRVMQNALAGFAVFQAWGNTPERFKQKEKPTDKETSGRSLLQAMSSWVLNDYTNKTNETEQIANFLKIPFSDAQIHAFTHIEKGDGLPDVFKDFIPVQWNYRLDHPRYEVIFLDARTFRFFPGSHYKAAEHLSEKAIDAQLPPLTEPREVTVVVSPCNVVTIPLFRNWLTVGPMPLAYYLQKKFRVEHHELMSYNPDAADSWVVGSPTFELLISRLAARAFQRVGDAKRTNRVVVLSGDVHFSAAGRMAYWAEKPFKRDPGTCEMVMAHLVASGMKNEAGAWKTFKLNQLGYEFVSLKGNLPDPEVMIGYAQKPDSLKVKAKENELLLRTRWFPDHYPSSFLRTPLLLPQHKIHPDVQLPKPEWMYRLDFFRGERRAPMPEQTGKFMHLFYARYKAPGSEIITDNNFASVSFDWVGEGKLTAALTRDGHTISVRTAQDRPFPPAPFYAFIGEEVVYVKKIAVSGDLATFMDMVRGKAHTTAIAHPTDAPVRIRQAVNQLHWETADKTEGDVTRRFGRELTLFKIPVEVTDPQFTQPSTNTL